ncbi:hypothetical protein HDU84_008732, partial [Entophlyctis sp. JEL0112]
KKEYTSKKEENTAANGEYKLASSVMAILNSLRPSGAGSWDSFIRWVSSFTT